MIVRELLTRLGFTVNETKLKQYEKSTDRIKRTAEGAAVGFRNMFAAFVGFQGLQALAHTADEVQSLEARIGQMAQTTGSAGDTFDAVANSATNARQSLTAYAQLYIRIGNASQDLIKEQSQLLGIVDTISQALVIGGTSQDEQASAMLQLSQAFNKGKLDGDEFKSVMEAMPPIFTRNLAAAMGYKDGLGEFYEASSKGKLTITALVDAINQISPMIAGQFNAMPMTIGQALTIVNNRYKVFVAKFNRESKVVTKVASLIVRAFDGVESAIYKLIDWFGGAERAAKVLGLALATLAAIITGKLLVSLIGMLISPAGLLFMALFAIAVVIEDIYTYMQGGESITGKFIQWLKDGSQNSKAFQGALLLLLSPLLILGGMLYTIYIAFNELSKQMNLTWDDFKRIYDIAMMTSPALRAIADIEPLLKSLLSVFSFVFDSIKRISNTTWDDVANGFDKMVDRIINKWSLSGLAFGMPALGGSIDAIKNLYGAGGGDTNNSQKNNVTINQNFPNYAPETIRKQAKEGASEGVSIAPQAFYTRQMNQAL